MHAPFPFVMHERCSRPRCGWAVQRPVVHVQSLLVIPPLYFMDLFRFLYRLRKSLAYDFLARLLLLLCGSRIYSIAVIRYCAE